MTKPTAISTAKFAAGMKAAIDAWASKFAEGAELDGRTLAASFDRFMDSDEAAEIAAKELGLNS